MATRTRVLVLLIFLTALWFVLGVVNGFVLPWMFAAYDEAGDAATTLMAVTIAMLVFFPTACVTTVVGGWRLFINERYGLAWKVALIPVPVAVAAGYLLSLTG